MLRSLFAIALTSVLVSAAVPAAETPTPRDLRFPCSELQCAAWLFLPSGAAKPPVVVMAHGFGGTRELGLEPFARRFAARGIAAFVFDYRFHGDSEGEPRRLIDPAEQLADWRSALVAARGLEEVDGERVALWGTSFSGGHVVMTAAEDPDIRAVVAQVPLMDSDADGESPGAAWIARALAAAAWDQTRALFGLSPHRIPVVAPEGGFALIVAPGAWEASQALGGGEDDLGVPARVLFALADYRPIERAAEVACPLLLVPARQDRLIPLASVEAAAAAAPHAELAIVEGEHFDVYLDPLFQEVVALEADFLVEKLAPAPRAAR